MFLSIHNDRINQHLDEMIIITCNIDAHKNTLRHSGHTLSFDAFTLQYLDMLSCNYILLWF